MKGYFTRNPLSPRLEGTRGRDHRLILRHSRRKYLSWKLKLAQNSGPFYLSNSVALIYRPWHPKSGTIRHDIYCGKSASNDGSPYRIWHVVSETRISLSMMGKRMLMYGVMCFDLQKLPCLINHVYLFDVSSARGLMTVVTLMGIATLWSSNTPLQSMLFYSTILFHSADIIFPTARGFLRSSSSNLLRWLNSLELSEPCFSASSMWICIATEAVISKGGRSIHKVVSRHQGIAFKVRNSQ